MKRWTLERRRRVDRILRAPVAPPALGGLDGIGRLVENCGFPATKRDLLEVCGNPHVDLGGAKTLQLHQILESLPEDIFLSEDQFHRALASNWTEVQFQLVAPEERVWYLRPSKGQHVTSRRVRRGRVRSSLGPVHPAPERAAISLQEEKGKLA